MFRISKKIKCGVCGNKIVAKRARTEVSTAFFGPTSYYDVMDCPKCGCEVTLTERKGPPPKPEPVEADAE